MVVGYTLHCTLLRFAGSGKRNAFHHQTLMAAQQVSYCWASMMVDVVSATLDSDELEVTCSRYMVYHMYR